MGRGVGLALQRPGDVTLAVAPAKPPASGTLSATVSFDVQAAGPHCVALCGPAWIDVVRDGKTVKSVTHGHGPTCSPVTMMDDFAPTPGRYALQLWGAKTAAVTVVVARATKAGDAG